ncbi:MAG TPA: RimK family alpha-L-glutamate ligase [Gallionella sp.]|nr:RimK family alpha-L-glutamate ligase [Gallionella sp.]
MDHPNPTREQAFIGIAELMRMAYAGTDLTPLGEALLARAGAGPDTASADALLDISTILQLKGNHEVALSIQCEALRLKQLYHLPAPRGATGIRLLALMTSGNLMANMPLDFLLEDSDIALDILYVAPHLPVPERVPDHDVLFVAIGEADETLALLDQLGGVLKNWPRPVLNRAERIAWLSRDRACKLLSELPGVAMPATSRLTRKALESIANETVPLQDYLFDAAFPIIVRPVGSHAGHGLEKIEHPADLFNYLLTIRQETFYISRFIDYRDTDGLFRKYRIVLIEGKPYAVHMGISTHWMIHYVNAGMADSADKRAEEAQFMAAFDKTFAPRHAMALQAIHQHMQLDYLVIDCAETQSGELLLFEVDNSAVVHTMDPVDLFPYKRPQMRKVFDAFRALLVRAIGAHPG